jgi:hypothetical protein
LNWAYGNAKYFREHGKAYWERPLGLGEMLYIAPPYLSDNIANDPAKWLKEMIAKYGQPNAA